VLVGIDALGLMMLAIMILVFGALATVKPSDVASLALPLVLVFLFGVVGIAGFSALVGKLLGYSIPMSISIGLTALFGFPGTMILSQEAAKGAGETPEEVAAIEHEILPKMIIAGFATVTITSVVVTSIIAGRIGTGSPPVRPACAGRTDPCASHPTAALPSVRRRCGHRRQGAEHAAVHTDLLGGVGHDEPGGEGGYQLLEGAGDA
jgi:hypothetical protein